MTDQVAQGPRLAASALDRADQGQGDGDGFHAEWNALRILAALDVELDLVAHPRPIPRAARAARRVTATWWPVDDQGQEAVRVAVVEWSGCQVEARHGAICAGLASAWTWLASTWLAADPDDLDARNAWIALGMATDVVQVHRGPRAARQPGVHLASWTDTRN